jgi:hypothetical protein
MLVYTGGIYPLPHTAVVLVVYSTLLALGMRSVVPVTRMASCALLGVGLSAPRILPILVMLRRYPRLVDSPETMGFSDFVQMLVSPQQDTWSMPVSVGQWGWHEWGMYVGWIPFVAIGLGVWMARGTREHALRGVGLLLVLLSFGRFFDYAPWALLHLMPVFSSQHVPSRWMVPALLVLAATAAATAERGLVRLGRARALVEIAAVFAVGWVVKDVCTTVRVPLTHTFGRPAPKGPDSLGEFRTERHVPPPIDYDPGEWSPSTLSALVANIGSIDCNTFPAFHNYYRDGQGRSPGMGAHGIGDPKYRGEVFVAEGHGTARVVKWTPNVIDVKVEGARSGDHVVLNQNWDPGWSANDSAAPAWQDQVSGVLVSGSDAVRFRYRPRTLWLGVFLLVASVGAVAAPWLLRVSRKMRAMALAPGRRMP